MTQFMILVLASLIKLLAILGITTILLYRWFHQSKRYLTDFPFLMGLTFAFYSLGKIFDIFLYYYLPNVLHVEDLSQAVASGGLLIGKMRFFISPFLVVIPTIILLLEIWIDGKTKWQITVLSSFNLSSLIAVIFANTYDQLLIVNMAISIIPIILTIITFSIIDRTKKMPQINSLMISIGWSLFLVSQLIRPIWKNLDPTYVWGLTWVGELVEMVPLVLMGVGFLIPARYAYDQ